MLEMRSAPVQERPLPADTFGVGNMVMRLQPSPRLAK
jgi:hypothetical protein